MVVTILIAGVFVASLICYSLLSSAKDEDPPLSYYLDQLGQKYGVEVSSVETANGYFIFVRRPDKIEVVKYTRDKDNVREIARQIVLRDVDNVSR